MYAIRMLPSLSNLGRKASGRPLYISVNYATKRLSIEEKLGFPERPKKPLPPYIDYCQKKFAEFSNVSQKVLPREIIPKFAEEWKLIDKETKTKLMNEYREKLQKYPDTLQQYYLSLTDAQRLELETVRNEKDASAQKRKLRLENRKTGKPIRPVNQFGIFVKEVFPKVSAGDSGKPNVQATLKDICKRWKNLTPEEKAPYKLKFEVADQEYQKKLVEWEDEMVRQGKANLVRVRARPILGLDDSKKFSKETERIKKPMKTK
ncbi:transcription factor A, mitochondrial-like [Daphnia pulex]|uniref:transcription factor A, mitochondrial-like n=1 Tax=Daphnia pulex TaxID=6669 RepID=UPI001EDF34EC|nr:transcription factor A, mitochondrial-like [Daphnia pulex]